VGAGASLEDLSRSVISYICGLKRSAASSYGAASVFGGAAAAGG